ncbi:hypothetical protein SAMN04515620_12668 [Collimonas sp. OK607]|nr:hypothetical protein SAMN04515620_12668 [Collimonas sp. OK607]
MRQIDNREWALLLDHMKQVARDDVRLYFAPFVWMVKKIKEGVNRLK